MNRRQLTRGICSDEVSDIGVDSTLDGSYFDYSKVGQSIVVGAQEPTGIAKLASLNFVKGRIKKGISTYTNNFLLNGYFKTLYDVLDFLKEKIFSDRWDDFMITMLDGSVVQLAHEEVYAIVTKSNQDVWFFVMGSREECAAYRQKIGKDDSRIKLNWWYKSEDGSHFDERDLDFHFNMSIHDEFYPYIPGGIKSYLAQYMNSKAPILVCLGEPGTGKTSFIRNFIHEYQLNTVVTYDDDIMAADSFYCQFLTDQNQHLLVIEDADVLLSDRERAGNKTMSKLLNVSDGLIQLGRKKIIFTTNLDTPSKMDEALIRPGRCFDVLMFDRLNYAQAQKACEVAGLPALDKEQSYSLTEIFNRTKHSYYSQRIGFK